MRTVVLQVVELSPDGIIGEEDTEFFQFCRDLPDDRSMSRGWSVAAAGQPAHHGPGHLSGDGRALPDDAGPIAEVMNSAPKAVFSRTLRSADWAGTTIVGGDIAEELDKLRWQGDGEILAHGGQLRTATGQPRPGR